MNIWIIGYVVLGIAFALAVFYEASLAYYKSSKKEQDEQLAYFPLAIVLCLFFGVFWIILLPLSLVASAARRNAKKK
jgi:hypothetical protein